MDHDTSGPRSRLDSWSLRAFNNSCSPSSTMSNYYPRSPPPLQHPVPTHPAFIPEPPSTPVSPHGYQRYTSSPPAPGQHQSFHPAQSTPYPQFQQQPRMQPLSQGQHPQQHGAPDFMAWGIDGATAQFGMQLGQNAVSAGQEYVQKNVRVSHLVGIRCCFPA